MRKRKATIAIHVFLIICALITLVPFGWMLLTSLKTYAESIQIPMVIFPELPQWSNYAKVWNNYPILRLYVNTFIVMILSIVSQILVCSLAAYAFARLKFPGKICCFC